MVGLPTIVKLQLDSRSQGKNHRNPTMVKMHVNIDVTKQNLLAADMLSQPV
jgi:hypothetical protein